MAVTAKLFVFLGASLIFSASAQRESFLTGLLLLLFMFFVLVCDTGISLYCKLHYMVTYHKMYGTHGL